MFPHWTYVLESLFGRVEAVTARAVTHIPERVDEKGKPYDATADDAAYGIFELDGGIIAQINSSWCVRGSTATSWWSSRSTARTAAPSRACASCRVQHRGSTPKPVWNPDVPADHGFRAQWQEVPDNADFDNGFKAQWEMFVRHVAEDAPFPLRLRRRSARRVRRRGRPAFLGRRPSYRTGAASMITRENRVLPAAGRRRFLLLPVPGGALESYAAQGPRRRGRGRPRGRTRHASRTPPPHVVADPLAAPSPAALDWDTTLAYRRHLWSYGMRVADAMDTAQRNAGLDWEAARELIRRSAAEAKSVRRPVRRCSPAARAPTRRPAPTPSTRSRPRTRSRPAWSRRPGARVILMASRQLAAVARGPEDYHEVYGARCWARPPAR